MSSLIKTISQILTDTESVSAFLLNADSYYAHLVPNSSKAPETLNEHILLVQKKFDLLADIHKIDSVVDAMILSLFSENKLEIDSQVANFIKKAWVNTIVFHDYGKVNENFQAHPEKMNNPKFHGKEIKDSPITTHHSSLGAYLYIVKHFEELSKLNRNYHGLLSVCVLTFSYSIFKHHGKFLGDNAEQRICFTEVEVNFIKKYINNYQWNLSTHFVEIIPRNTNKIFENNLETLNSFALYSLVRLSFSMLTASDFLASGEYMSDLVVNSDEFGVLRREKIESIYQYLTTSETKKDGSINFNKSTFELSRSNYAFKTPQHQSNENLNILRQEMGVEALQNIRSNFDKNLFYIEAPTGGGKTNLSFLATIELLKLNSNLNKVYYVFPFTTLVTQTQKSLIDTLGLSTDEVITLSSKAGFKEKAEQDKVETEEDDRYGKQKRFYLDNLFCFFPFCLMTHVKFFNILKTNVKEENYLLHRLANSVVVLDEMQAYSPSEWDKVIYFIKNYAHYYNMKFIVMSATLPKLGNLKIKGLNESDFVYLIDNAKSRYFQNPNFSERVSFNLDLFDSKDLKLETLAEKLITVSKEYTQKDFGKAKPRGSVYTIIEFIFKKSATEFYEIIDKKECFFDEVFVLSGTILEHRRKYIINYLKDKDNRKKKVLLITTQVVEAGVDIDMDLGFKDTSLIDSDEQLAGRINRNVNKEGCVLYLFNYNNEKVIYGKDKRYIKTAHLKKEEYFEILKTKEFDKIYNNILEEIDADNKKEHRIGFDEYEQNIKQLRFQSTHFDFQLIAKEHENLTVFIPLDVPLYVDGVNKHETDPVFSENEIHFLETHCIYPTDKNCIQGSKVFDLYLNLLQQKGDFSIKKIGNKILQGIMSKFVIQLLGTNKIKTQLIDFQDEEKSDKGYIYLERWNESEEKLYNECFGLNDKAFNNIENQFL